MSLISGLSLHCVNYNNRLVATCDSRLILETLTKPAEKNAVWIALYHSASWILINQVSLMCLIFDGNSKLISRLEKSGLIIKKSLEVEIGDRHLLLRLSPTTSVTAENKLCLELIDKNDADRKPCPVFFVHEGFDQLFRDIDPDFSNSLRTTIKTIADVVKNYYDYVVIGSSFCSLAFIHQTLQNNPKAKILVLEKGLKYLLEHHQHCDTSSSPGGVESRPWTIADETIQNEFLKNVHGQIPLLGGRSTYWSGWSPTPSSKELVEWPEDLKTTLQETYFSLAQKFLGVVPASEIKAYENNDFIYRTFQSCLKKCLDSARDIESVDQVHHAPLAMGNER